MSAEVIDLLASREYRRRAGMYFDSPTEALTFTLDRLEALRGLSTGALLVPGADVAQHVDQLSAIVRACIDSHEHASHDEGETR